MRRAALLALAGCWVSEGDVRDVIGGPAAGDTDVAPDDTVDPGTPGDTDAADTDPPGPGDTDAVDTDPPGPDTDADTEVADTDEPPPPPPTCALGDLGLPRADMVVDQAPGDGDLTLTCNGNGAGGPDDLWQFTAPTAGCWVFHTAGATYDTVLGLRRTCDGVEVACNDDGLGLAAGQSRTAAWMEASEALLVAVDAYDASEVGTYALTVEEDPTAAVHDADLGAVEGAPLWTGSTVHTATTMAFDGCDDASGKDQLLLWTAPYEGVFDFLTVGARFDVVLSIYTACELRVLTCQDEYESGDEVASVWLTEGQRVIVRVAGYEDDQGAYGAGTLSLGVLAH